MKKMILQVLTIISVSFVFVSCSPNRQYIQRHFSNLEGKRSVSVVIAGNPFYEPRWVSGTSSEFNDYIRDNLQKIFDVPISVLNSSGPEDTFNTFSRRVETDVLSYRPDIVFFMLGFIDSNQSEQTLSYFRDHVKNLFSTFQNAGTTVIVLTSIGNRDAINPYDPGMERLVEYNEVILWEAGHHDFAVIDVAGNFERLRVSNYDKYYSLFLNELMLNIEGKKYAFDLVFDYIDKAYRPD